MSVIANRIGKRLKTKRIECGYTQEKVAELANLHPTYIGQVERGEKNLTIESLEKLCIALNYPMNELMTNLPSDEQYSSIADQCYDIIIDQTPENQAELLRILKYITTNKK